MQGIYIDGRRPKSKKEVKEAVQAGQLDRIDIEATSWFGNEYGGPLTVLVAQAVNKGLGVDTIYFVGPDPHTKRNFYGSLDVGLNGKVKVA